MFLPTKFQEMFMLWLSQKQNSMILSWESIQNSWVFLTIPFRSRSEFWRYHGICPWGHYSQIFIFRGWTHWSTFYWTKFLEKEWLLSCSYNPNKNNISNHLQRLRNSLDLYSAKYEKIILIGDFNVSPEYSHFENLMC